MTRFTDAAANLSVAVYFLAQLRRQEALNIHSPLKMELVPVTAAKVDSFSTCTKPCELLQLTPDESIWVTRVEVKRGCSMDDAVKSVLLEYTVKRAWRANIFNNDVAESISVVEELLKVFSLSSVLRANTMSDAFQGSMYMSMYLDGYNTYANGTNDSEASYQRIIGNPRADKSTGSGDQNLARCDGGHVPEFNLAPW